MKTGVIKRLFIVLTFPIWWPAVMIVGVIVWVVGCVIIQPTLGIYEYVRYGHSKTLRRFF